MFAVHVGPGPRPEGAGYLIVAADGRAPALFTLLAGFSLALAQRGRAPAEQPDGWARRYRPLVIRCAILAGLGLLLAALWPGILVILAFFAVYFLAAEPFTRLSTPVLTAVAGVSVVAGPLLSFLLGPVFGYEASGRGAVPELTALTGREGLARVLCELLLTGAYPLATYFPYVLVGLALGRLCDLREGRAARRMAVWGAAAAAAGYGTAWVATHVLGGRERLLDVIAARHPEALGTADPVREVLRGQFGAVPSTSWEWLLVADPYSQTPLETIGNAGWAAPSSGSSCSPRAAGPERGCSGRWPRSGRWPSARTSCTPWSWPDRPTEPRPGVHWPASPVWHWRWPGPGNATGRTARCAVAPWNTSSAWPPAAAGPRDPRARRAVTRVCDGA